MGRSRGFDDFRRFPPSVPRKVEGGIRAHSKRGAFASSWWGRRWIEVLEGFGLGARLQRGRRYARQGQVLTLEVETGEVAATVQGSRARPYRVEIRLPPIPAGRWEEMVERLAGDVRVGARLMAGEMPPEVEAAAADSDARLFPQRLHDLETSCSCPDWSNPCKHIAAVHYLLAEELDRDPFLLFRLRGMDRESFAAALARAGEMLGEGEGAGPPGDEAPDGSDLSVGPDESASEGDGAREAVGELWPTDPGTFWGGPDVGVEPDAERDGEAGSDTGSGASAKIDAGIPPAPTTHAALVRRLGAFPFWRGERPFVDEMVELYRKASSQARELLESDAE